MELDSVSPSTVVTRAELVRQLRSDGRSRATAFRAVRALVESGRFLPVGSSVLVDLGRFRAADTRAKAELAIAAAALATPGAAVAGAWALQLQGLPVGEGHALLLARYCDGRGTPFARHARRGVVLGLGATIVDARRFSGAEHRTRIVIAGRSIEALTPESAALSVMAYLRVAGFAEACRAVHPTRWVLDPQILVERARAMGCDVLAKRVFWAWLPNGMVDASVHLDTLAARRQLSGYVSPLVPWNERRGSWHLYDVLENR